MHTKFILYSFISCLGIFISCQKGEYYKLEETEALETTTIKSVPNVFIPSIMEGLSYGDSVFYIKTNTTNKILPTKSLGKGKYLGFPGGVEIDSLTGEIDISESETGLRYKIMFVPEGTSDTIQTKIVISGINFYDHIFNLSKGDTIAQSIYNASGLPFVKGQFGVGNNCVFDEGAGCNKQGCAVSYENGSINLAKSLREGAISRKNDSQKEFTYYYRMDDKSENALNHLKIKLYYYNSEKDIPQYLWDILLKERIGTIIPGLTSSSGFRRKVATPRPPCLIIVAN